MQDLATVYATLRAVMAPYAALLDTQQDDASGLYVNTRFIQKNKKPLYFGAVMLKKAYVSYHLMPIYVKPELLNGLSPALLRRKHGKACFNFAAIDSELIAELAALTQVGFDSYREQGFVCDQSRS